MRWFQHVSTCKTSYKSNWIISARAENSNCEKQKARTQHSQLFLLFNYCLIKPRVSQENLSCSPSSASMASPLAASSEAEAKELSAQWTQCVKVIPFPFGVPTIYQGEFMSIRSKKSQCIQVLSKWWTVSFEYDFFHSSLSFIPRADVATCIFRSLLAQVPWRFEPNKIYPNVKSLAKGIARLQFVIHTAS